MSTSQNSRLLLVVAGTIVALIGGFVASSARIVSRERWVPYDPALATKLWEDQTYTEIEHDSSFYARIKDSIANALARARETNVHERHDQLARLVSNFLSAYAFDSFEDFWRFRAPTDYYSTYPGVDVFLRSMLESPDLRVLGKDEYLGAHGDNTKVLVEKVWLSSIHSRRQRPVAGDSSSFFFRGLCTNCLSAAALDTIEIVGSPRTPSPIDLVVLLRNAVNTGVATHTGYFNAMPEDESKDTVSYRPRDYVCVKLLVRLRNKVVHPVYIVAGWSSAGACYTPIAIGVPVSGERRALFPF